MDEQILDKDVQESPKPRTPTPIQTSYFRSSLPDLIAGSTGLRRKKVEPIKSGFMIESKRPKVFKAAKELGRGLGTEVENQLRIKRLWVQIQLAVEYFVLILITSLTIWHCFEASGLCIPSSRSTKEHH